jgi:hypothetical protein
MPIYLRQFYFKRLDKQYKTETDEIKKQQKKVNQRFKK